MAEKDPLVAALARMIREAEAARAAKKKAA